MEAEMEDSDTMAINKPDSDDYTVQMDIAKLIVNVIDYLRKQGVDESVSVKVSAMNYSGDESDIEFSVGIRYEDAVVSHDLMKSARVALERHNETKSLKPLRIGHYK